MSKRFAISPAQLIAAAAVYMVAVLNTRFLGELLAALQPSTAYQWAFVAAMGVLLIALYVLGLTIFSLPYVLKPVTAGLVVLTVALAYYMREYGVVIDVNMVHNVLETDTREARDLITANFALTLAGLGIVPALIIAAIPVRWPGFVATVAQNFRRGFLAGGLSVAIVAVFFATFVSFMREHRSLLLMLAPSNAIEATLKYAFSARGGTPPAVTPIATDARKGPYWETARRPAVVVLVIGETARADKFSLNGYGRKTDPQLEAVDGLISFANATSCGTDTAESVPCIFSGLGRENFTHARANAQEGLLDVVRRLGFDVLWRENQSGCKGACTRVPTEQLTHLKLAPYCNDGECHDEILMDHLGEKIKAMPSGGVIVLHMMGSHGPAYYKRYPAPFRTFVPTCDMSQFSACSRDEIVNTYDNTILYTDHVLRGIIDTMSKVSTNVDTVMLYASDHGESLGENGLYLHGMPYALAPREQTHIPMMIWMSPAYANAFGIDRTCLGARSKDAVSHDNIFPTVLGMLDIDTAMHDEKHDLLAPCRAQPHAKDKHAATVNSSPAGQH